MAKKPPRKFNVAALSIEVEQFTKRLMKRHAVPYLQHLLDAAQAKTRYELWLSQGMGMCSLYCEAPWQRGSWDTVDRAAEAELYPLAADNMVDPKVLRMREKFPELIEFFRLVLDLGDMFTDDMRPKGRRKPIDLERDPADYVEQGPILKCASCKLSFLEDELYERGMCFNCVTGAKNGEAKEDGAGGTPGGDRPAVP